MIKKRWIALFLVCINLLYSSSYAAGHAAGPPTVGQVVLPPVDVVYKERVERLETYINKKYGNSTVEKYSAALIDYNLESFVSNKGVTVVLTAHAGVSFGYFAIKDFPVEVSSALEKWEQKGEGLYEVLNYKDLPHGNGKFIQHCSLIYNNALEPLILVLTTLNSDEVFDVTKIIFQTVPEVSRLQNGDLKKTSMNFIKMLEGKRVLKSYVKYKNGPNTAVLGKTLLNMWHDLSVNNSKFSDKAWKYIGRKDVLYFMNEVALDPANKSKYPNMAESVLIFNELVKEYRVPTLWEMATNIAQYFTGNDKNAIPAIDYMVKKKELDKLKDQLSLYLDIEGNASLEDLCARINRDEIIKEGRLELLTFVRKSGAVVSASDDLKVSNNDLDLLEYSIEFMNKIAKGGTYSSTDIKIVADVILSPSVAEFVETLDAYARPWLNDGISLYFSGGNPYTMMEKWKRTGEKKASELYRKVIEKASENPELYKNPFIERKTGPIK